MSGTCPARDACAFFQTVTVTPILRIKYATMYPYCNANKHETCMLWWHMQQGREVPADLLPDGGRDWFSREARRNVPGTGHRVLVIDDLPLFRKALVSMVQKAASEDVTIVEAESAESALALLASDTGDWMLVVTDYNMGAKSGYDLIAGMRANPAHAQLPAIIFSSDSDEAKRAQCENLPRVRWLVKRPEQQPFDAAWQELIVDRKA